MAHAEPVRLAVVGSGNIANRRHLPAVQALAGRAAVVAAVDVDPARAEHLAATWDIPHTYTDLELMLAEQLPDLAVICTPPAAHREAILACLDAGVSVWCEKPPTMSLAEYDELTDREGAQGPYASFVFQHRFGSAARHLRQQIERGELGRPLVAICNTLWYRGHDYFTVPWRGKWATEGGGPSMGHGIHQIDLMLHLLGDWTEIRASMGTIDRDIEVEDVSMAAVQMENGAMLSIVNSLLSPRESSYLRLDFTDATVELEHTYGYDNSNWTWTAAKHAAAGSVLPPTKNIRSSHAEQLAALLDALAAGVRPAVSGADGRRTLELVTGLYQSAITGKPVQRTSLVPGNPFYHSMNGRPQALEVA